MNTKIGNMTINDKEIQIKTLTTKTIIPLHLIKQVTYKEPGTITKGNMTITPYYNKPIKINISRNQKTDATQTYHYLHTIAEQNNIPIQALEQDPELNPFRCLINEERQTILRGKTTESQKATVQVYEDRIVIDKQGVFKSDKGTKTVLFQDITSVDLDMSMTFNYVVLTMAGSGGVTLKSADPFLVERFYDLLLYRFDMFKRAGASVSNAGSVSDADELERWHDLLLKGVITQEEFELKKKELLGL